ncbi:MAG: amidohydrolase, partial [Bacteroidota bacterium]
MLKERIKQLAKNKFEEVRGYRRHLHQYPELSYQEKETSAYVAKQLDQLGITHQTNVGGYGVIGLIEGKLPGGRVIALRADMDALPIEEANEVPYRSKNPGVMHACGHDVHTASLLGAATILQEMRDQFAGTIKLIFQPAEEKLPGGASILIEEGVLENPTPELIIGQHVHPPLEAGKVGFRGGMYMASADEIYLTIHGKGGHGALPQECIDPIVISAHVITALQQLVSRRANPTVPSVLTFGKIASDGGTTNVIPNAVSLMGTFRTMNEEWRQKAHELMEKMVHSLVEGMGGQADLNIVKGYPFLINDPDLTASAQSAAEDFLGAEQVIELPIRMTAEDFSYYSQKIPACFYRLGTGNKAQGISSPVHT